MNNSVIQKEGVCLNCGTEVQGNYCSNCGQKFQPTKLPLNQFLEDAVETLFNLDNRVLKTLKDLFLKPGKVTLEYIEGKRATYLPPLRIYISISVIYFLIAELIGSEKILFVNFTQDGDSQINLAKVIQIGMFFLVPVMAAILKLLHRKRKAFYVEYLIFSMHIHTIWFVLFTFQLMMVYIAGVLEGNFPSLVNNIIYLTGESFQIGAFIFFGVYVKKVFLESWLKTILKSVATIFLYLLCLALVTFVAIGIL